MQFRWSMQFTCPHWSRPLLKNDKPTNFLFQSTSAFSKGLRARCADIDPSKIVRICEWQQSGSCGAAFDKGTEVRSGPKGPPRITYLYVMAPGSSRRHFFRLLPSKAQDHLILKLL